MEQQILQLLGGTGGQGKSPGGSSFPRLTPGPSGGGLGNSIVPTPDSSSGLDPAIADLLRRMTAFRGGGMEGILAMLNNIIGNDGGGGGNGGGNGNGNGSGAGCLAGDVMVRMADGSEKPASEIRVDDQIIGLDMELGPTPQTVTCTNSSRQLCYRVEIEGLEAMTASSSHRWFTTRGLVVTPDLRVGESLVGEHGPVRVNEVMSVGIQIVHWWNCDPNHCYFAGGVLHHNITPDTYKGHGWNTSPYPSSYIQAAPTVGTGPGEG